MLGGFLDSGAFSVPRYPLPVGMLYPSPHVCWALCFPLKYLMA